MNNDDFIESMNKLRRKYNFIIDENADYWPYMTGFLFYRDEKTKEPFAHIGGVRYSSGGGRLKGDFEGVLKLLNESIDKEFNS